MSRLHFLILTLFLPTFATAQDDTTFLELGGDLYGGGSAVVATDVSADDVFLAGQDARLAVSITGSAHLAGQTVVIAQPVGALGGG